MTAFKKVAVSIPVDTFRSLEKARARRGQTRSEVVALAVAEWLRGLEASEQRRRYAEGYLRLPERATGSDVAIVGAATADWSNWQAPEPSYASEDEPPRRARRR